MTLRPSPLPDPQLSGLTQRQKELARHALGLAVHHQNWGGKSFRNYFLAAGDTEEETLWRSMVAGGAAISGKRRMLGVPFALTRAGAELALNPGESLDPEDFPPGNDGLTSSPT